MVYLRFAAYTPTRYYKMRIQKEIIIAILLACTVYARNDFFRMITKNRFHSFRFKNITHFHMNARLTFKMFFPRTTWTKISIGRVNLVVQCKFRINSRSRFSFSNISQREILMRVWVVNIECVHMQCMYLKLENLIFITDNLRVWIQNYTNT